MRTLAVAICLSAVVLGCTTPTTSGPAVSPVATAIELKDDYTVLFGKGLIEVGAFSDVDLGPVIKKFDERVAAKDFIITFRIDSFGGDVFAGMDFIQHVEDAVKANPGTIVQCVVDTKAYSMGFAFLQSGACEQRFMTKRSTLLAHNSKGGSKGGAKDLASDAAFLSAIDEGMAQMVSDRLEISLDDYQHKVDGRDWTMAATEAYASNAVDDLVSPKDLPPAFKLDEPETDLMKLLGF